MSKQKVIIKSFSTTSLLGILFVGLKLTGAINWSWFWVTAPFWGGLAIGLSIMAIMSIFVFLMIGIKVLIELR